MSRSLEEWDEQHAIALSVRRCLWDALDHLDRIDDIRFEVADNVAQLERDLKILVGDIERVIGALTVCGTRRGGGS